MKYPNVLSTIKPVPHGPSIPVPEVTGDISEMECSSSTESKASEKDTLNAEPSTKLTEALNTALTERPNTRFKSHQRIRSAFWITTT